MTNPIGTGTMSQAQAQLLLSLMETQTQTAAINSFLGDATASGDSASQAQGTSFSSLLTSVLGMGAKGTTASTGTDSSLLSNGMLSANIIAASGTGGSATGQRIAAVATQLAGDLRGIDNRSFDAIQTPQAAQATFTTAGWGNGNVQCVAFVAGAYNQAGITLPTTPNATDFWTAYANRPGWNEIPNGQGVPQPGDIIVMGGGAEGLGHVAIVTAVTPPTNGQPGQIAIAQSNSPTAQTNITLNTDGTITSWPGYPIKGIIRPAGN